jgi:transposase
MEKYTVSLTKEERHYLLALIKKGKTSAYKLTHARILLEADENGSENKTDVDIAKQLHVGAKTVKRIRKRLVEEGLEAALCRKPHAMTKSKKITGEEEAHLIALSCSTPPVGRNRWTLQLLSERMVELKIIDSVSPATVGRALKKTK